MEQQIADLVRMMSDLTGSNEAILQKVEEIAPAVKSLTEWRPDVEKSVGELKTEIHQLKDQIHQIEKTRFELSEEDKKAVEAQLKGYGPHLPKPPPPPLLPTPPPTWRVDPGRTAPKGGDDGPVGHRLFNQTR